MYQILVVWTEDDSRSITYRFKTEVQALAFSEALDEMENHLGVVPFSVSKGTWKMEQSHHTALYIAISFITALWGSLWWYLLTSSQRPLEYIAVGLITGSAYYLGSLFLRKFRSLL